MHIHIIAIGKIREPYLKEGIASYLARITPMHRVFLRELPEQPFTGKPSQKGRDAVKEHEGQRLIAASPTHTIRIALNPGGEMLTSEQLAERMSHWELEGHGSLSFFIGGPLGLSMDVVNHADLVLSLSSMTFPHQLVRLLLIEQIYRAACIGRGIPYHK